ncbi:MAG: VWA domain-containing protein [Deltaproteobacteria bacterium]|nr:VWA domain-containing protein [Deltaproteobacteria bacterium]
MRRLLHRLAPAWWSLGLLAVAAAFYLPEWVGEGAGMKLASPWFLLGLFAVPLVIAAGLLESRTAGRLRFPLAGPLAAIGPTWRTFLVPVSVGLRATAVTLLAVALARPQDSTQPDETELKGIDMVLVLDVSMSMKATDLEPTRLDASKAVVQDFIKRRKNDRIGAVIFAENAYTLCPLTLDYSVLASMIDDVKLGVISGNATAIGNAVGVALNRLRKSDAKSKAVILLTDGASNAGNISPEQATTFAKTLGIKIYTVLMGERDVASVASGLDFFKQQIFGTQNVPINRELLEKMSKTTGGAFFEATDRKGLESSFHAILDALERSRIADQGMVWSEAFRRYLWPALFVMILDLFLTLAVLRRTP